MWCSWVQSSADGASGRRGGGRARGAGLESATRAGPCPQSLQRGAPATTVAQSSLLPLSPAPLASIPLTTRHQATGSRASRLSCACVADDQTRSAVDLPRTLTPTASLPARWSRRPALAPRPWRLHRCRSPCTARTRRCTASTMNCCMRPRSWSCGPSTTTRRTASSTESTTRAGKTRTYRPSAPTLARLHARESLASRTHAVAPGPHFNTAVDQSHQHPWLCR